MYEQVSLIFEPVLGTFLFFCWLSLSTFDVMVFVLSNFTFKNVFLLSLRGLFFSNERQGVDPYGRRDREGLGGVEGEKTVFRLYCMRNNLCLIQGGGRM